MRGKTGSLDGVSGLLGMVDLGRSVTFAFLDNGDFSEAKAAGLRARAATLIAVVPERAVRRRAGPQTGAMTRGSLHRA